jgi:hypothetical protein
VQTSEVNDWCALADTCDVRDWLYLFCCGAGRGARNKYKTGLKRWRRRALGPVRLVFVALTVALFVASRLDHVDITSWMLGLAQGAVLAMYMVLRDSPPPHIEHWRIGLEGEQRTAKVLAPLRRRGYALLHDLRERREGERDRKCNIDHVVVSTAGVFLLDSKYLGGEATVSGDRVRVQMLDDDDNSYSFRMGATMRRRAYRLVDDLGTHADTTTVHPVVVFWNRFPAGLAYEDGVTYRRGDRLVAWLQEQAPQIGPEMIARLVATIEQARPRENRMWWERLASLALHRPSSTS